MAYFYTGKFDRLIELARTEIGRSGDPLAFARTQLAFGFGFLGLTDEATAMADDAVAAAEASANPYSLSWALSAYGNAHRGTERALAALRRGMVVARAGGVRFFEALNAMYLAAAEAEHGDLRAALDLFAQAINSFHDSNDTLTLGTTLGLLAVCFERTGRHEAATRLQGASNSSLGPALPEFSVAADHLREMLGEEVFNDLVREGAAMERADAVKYAHEQIQRAREELGAAP
jgi:tetratricopeptide (TPR) repeat protein